MENLSQRKCLDILLAVLLSVIAICQVYESCIKFVKRQTTQSVSFQDTDIVFPSMTICDKNGFKSSDVMERANMSNFRLMTKVNTTSDIRIYVNLWHSNFWQTHGRRKFNQHILDILYWQLSQGQIANFPASIAPNIFDL